MEKIIKKHPSMVKNFWEVNGINEEKLKIISRVYDLENKVNGIKFIKPENKFDPWALDVRLNGKYSIEQLSNFLDRNEFATEPYKYNLIEVGDCSIGDYILYVKDQKNQNLLRVYFHNLR